MAHSVRNAGLLALVLFLVGCDSGGEEAPREITFTASVQQLIMGSGPPAWIFDVDNQDAPFYPLNLPAGYQEEDLRVRVRGLHILHYDVALMDPVEILSITRIEP